MATAAVPFLIFTSAVGAVASIQQGRAVAAESRRAAHASKINAQSKEIARRRGLLKTLAAQNNVAGITGQTPNEGFQVMQENDLKWYDLDIETARIEEGINQATYSARGRNAMTQGYMGAIDRAGTGAWQYSMIN